MPEDGNGNFFFANQKVRITPEGGIAIKLTNKSGANSTKGYLVHPSSTVDNAVDLVPLDEPDIIGVFYEDGIADGEEAWVVISGIADVYYFGGSVREELARMGQTADGGSAGEAISDVLPSPPFATDKHFQEIGHVIENRVGNGLAKTVLHFN